MFFYINFWTFFDPKIDAFLVSFSLPFSIVRRKFCIKAKTLISLQIPMKTQGRRFHFACFLIQKIIKKGTLEMTSKMTSKWTQKGAQKGSNRDDHFGGVGALVQAKRSFSMIDFVFSKSRIRVFISICNEFACFRPFYFQPFSFRIQLGPHWGPQGAHWGPQGPF